MQRKGSTQHYFLSWSISCLVYHHQRHHVGERLSANDGASTSRLLVTLLNTQHSQQENLKTRPKYLEIFSSSEARSRWCWQRTTTCHCPLSSRPAALLLLLLRLLYTSPCCCCCICCSRTQQCLSYRLSQSSAAVDIQCIP